MTSELKDRIVVVLCLLALIAAFYFLAKSEKVQAKIDEILFGQDKLYAQVRENTQASPEAIMTDEHVVNSHGFAITISLCDPKKITISVEKREN